MMDDLVGIPYKDDGLTPEEGFGCYGLVRWVLNTELGLALPEKPPAVGAWPHYVKIYRPAPAQLQRYDVVMFSDILPGLANHVGVLASAYDFLHAEAKCGGVVLDRISRYQFKVIGIGRPLTAI